MTTIMPYNPLNETLALREAMDRLFADSFVASGAGRKWTGRGAADANFYETADSFEVHMPLPGVKLEEVAISARENVVMVKWETKAQTPEGAQSLWTEMRYGAFQQSFTLPAAVNADTASAHFNNGILFLHLPKDEHAKPKTIKINVGQPTQTQTIAANQSAPDTLITPNSQQ